MGKKRKTNKISALEIRLPSLKEIPAVEVEHMREIPQLEEYLNLDCLKTWVIALKGGMESSGHPRSFPRFV